MKPALQFIPTEVWVDVFRYPGKSRKELGEIVDQIGNRKFAEFLQFYLHEWGKRTLSEVYLEQVYQILNKPNLYQFRHYQTSLKLQFQKTSSFLRPFISRLFLSDEKIISKNSAISTQERLLFSAA